jgi:prepilin-type N-terminal cleavage/methylation domain-containing protein
MRTKRGFTLVELLIVIIIISVMATIAIPKFADSNTRAKEASLKAYLYSLRTATERFHADTGLWPLSADIINGTTPSKGLNEVGTKVVMPDGVYFGPYFAENGSTIGIPGVTLTYGSGGPIPIGSWKLTGTAVASDGTLFSSW